MKYAIAMILALLSVAAFAQTVHTASYGPYLPGNPGGQFTLIDGNPPNCGIGYCGSIQIRENEAQYWGLEAPNGPNGGWLYPNGGFLDDNTFTPNEGQLVWDNPGCGPKVAGCTAHTDTTITFIGLGAGVTVSVHNTFIVVFTCKRACDNDSDDIGVYSTNPNGGTITAVYNPPLTANSAFAIECCYYGGRCICLPIPNPYCQINHYHCDPEIRARPLKEILK